MNPAIDFRAFDMPATPVELQQPDDELIQRIRDALPKRELAQGEKQ